MPKLNELGFYTLAGHSATPRDLLDEVADPERLGLGSAFVSERFATKEAATLCGAVAAARGSGRGRGRGGPVTPTLHDHDWLLAPDAEGAVLLSEVLVSATDAFVDRYGPRLARDDVATLRAVAEAIGDWVLGRTTPYGLVHGDYRLDNLLFAPVGGSADASAGPAGVAGAGPAAVAGAGASGDAGAGPAGDAGVAAVDWQTLSIGLPGRDIAYLLGTGLDPGERRRHEDDLVAAYHAALVGHGVAGYSRDDCLADYRYGAVQGPLVTALGAAYGAPTDRGDDMFMAMAARSCAQVRDLATLDLL
ncbi:MAG TPA: oxidoreductase family protein [Acidimicrobiales bacterium]|nr:oxidoreductase family protein [Acidimicrobiales bacterium]